MFHRLREAMADPTAAPIGGEGKIIESDEGSHGTVKEPELSPRRYGRPYTEKNRPAPKRPIVERGGEARITHMAQCDCEDHRRIHGKKCRSEVSPEYGREQNMAPSARISRRTRPSTTRPRISRGDVTINTAEGYFGVLKHGLTGVYQHCDEQPFQRYLDEFSFCFSNRTRLGMEDTERAEKLTKGTEGKRLTYPRIAARGKPGGRDRFRLNCPPPAITPLRDLDNVEHVARPKEGGVLVFGRRGGPKVHINVLATWHSN
jgi:ISXO2-like transposase domain